MKRRNTKHPALKRSGPGFPERCWAERIRAHQEVALSDKPPKKLNVKTSVDGWQVELADYSPRTGVSPLGVAVVLLGVPLVVAVIFAVGVEWALCLGLPVLAVLSVAFGASRRRGLRTLRVGPHGVELATKRRRDVVPWSQLQAPSIWEHDAGRSEGPSAWAIDLRWTPDGSHADYAPSTTTWRFARLGWISKRGADWLKDALIEARDEGLLRLRDAAFAESLQGNPSDQARSALDALRDR